MLGERDKMNSTYQAMSMGDTQMNVLKMVRLVGDMDMDMDTDTDTDTLVTAVAGQDDEKPTFYKRQQHTHTHTLEKNTTRSYRFCIENASNRTSSMREK